MMLLGIAQIAVDILYLVGGLLVGGVAGFFIARGVMTKYIKNNPPINEKMIEAMMSQMGRKPSKTQVKQVMASMNRYK